MSSDTQRVSIVYLTPRGVGHKSLKYVPKPKTINDVLVARSDTIERLLLQQQPEGKHYLTKDNTMAFYFKKDAEGVFSICPAASGQVFKHGKDMERETVASVNSAVGTPISKIVFVADTWEQDVAAEMKKHFKMHEPEFQNGWFSNGRLESGNDDHKRRAALTFSINCELMVPPPPPYFPRGPSSFPYSFDQSHTARVHCQFHRHRATHSSARSRLQTNHV
jgi:hypothetical protein